MVVAVAAIAVAALLVVLAVELAHQQSTTRKGVETRFRDRVRVTSALTEAILSASTSSADLVRRYGSGTVTGAQLDQAARQGRLAYAVVVDKDGAILASTPGLTASARARLLTRPAPIRGALRGAPFTVSNVLDTGPAGGPVVELAQSLTGTDGRRVVISGVSPNLLSLILGGYLARIPSRSDETAYVLDRHGRVVASREGDAPIGAPVNEPGLRDAVARRTSGSFAADRYFVLDGVGQTPWRVVLTARKSQLFASVSGARKWVPWMIFAAFAAAALVALFLLRRTLRGAAALSEANARLHDANAQLQSTNSLLRRAAELARSNAELEQFASIASHDLQEPLRKVQTFAAQLNTHERERLSDEGQDYLRRMSDAAGRMRMLIEDLLMYSRVSTTGRPFARVDLGAVARQVVSDLEVAIEETGADVAIESLPTISADPTQMRQLLQNLIANALKFRRDGVTPEIRISAHGTNGTAGISVRDNGIGFDPQYSGRIFRAFERLHSRTAYPGTGIGLALCRKIVERHHGTIVAHGTPGIGSVFTVTLPVEQVSAVDDGTAAADEVLDRGEAHVNA